jgi:hypothetical protein
MFISLYIFLTNRYKIISISPLHLHFQYIHTKDTRTHIHTHIPKNTELTTDFYQDSEEVPHHVKADQLFIMRNL